MLVLVLVGVGKTVRVRMRLPPKPDRRSSPGLRRLRVPIARRRVRDERLEQMLGGMSDVVHGAIESFLVRFRGFRKPTKLADELKRGGANFVLSRRRQEVMQGLNVSAHGGFS
ncbi:MAG: hypothetical protein QOH01_55 [Verrucomicrobiota bacterium]|jgi:hypothetical protein